MKTAAKWALLALAVHTLAVPLLIVVGDKTFQGIGYELERAQKFIDAPVERLVWHTGYWLGPLQVRAAEATGTDTVYPFWIFLYCFYGGAFYFVVTFLLAGAILRMKMLWRRPRSEKNAAI